MSITTAGREAAGSIRKKENTVLVLILVVKVDPRLRSCRGSKGEDHGREGRFEERKSKEEYDGGGGGESDCDCDLESKRKQRLNAQPGSLELVIAPPPISKTIVQTKSTSSNQLHHHCFCACFFFDAFLGNQTTTHRLTPLLWLSFSAR